MGQGDEVKSDVIRLGALSGEVGRPARVLWESAQVEDDGRVLFPVYGGTEEDVPCYFTSEVLTWLAWRVGADVPDRSDAPAVRSILAALAAREEYATVRFARSVGERVIEAAQVEFAVVRAKPDADAGLVEELGLVRDYTGREKPFDPCLRGPVDVAPGQIQQLVAERQQERDAAVTQKRALIERVRQWAKGGRNNLMVINLGDIRQLVAMAEESVEKMEAETKEQG